MATTVPPQPTGTAPGRQTTYVNAPRADKSVNHRKSAVLTMVVLLALVLFYLWIRTLD